MLVPGDVKLRRETCINGCVNGTRSRLISGTHIPVVKDTRRRVIVGTRRRAINCWFSNTCNYCTRRRLSFGTSKHVSVGT